MEQLYESFLKYYKSQENPLDYDLLLIILIYPIREQLTIDSEYRPTLYYYNQELFHIFIDKIINDLGMTKEQFFQQFSDDSMDYDDLVWSAFPNTIDFFCELYINKDNCNALEEECCEKMKLYMENQKKISI